MARGIVSLEEDEAQDYFARQSVLAIKGHRSSVRSVAWNASGTRLASSSTDRTVRVWNPDKPDVRNSTELRGHTASVDQIAWDPSHPDRLASVSADKSVRLWDTRTSKSIREFKTSAENLYVDWSPDGKHLSVGSRDNVVTFFDVTERKIVNRLHEPVEANESRWTNNGRLWMLTTGTGLVKIFSWPNMELVHTVDAHTSNCFCIQMDPAGQCFAVGGADAVVSVWDTVDVACQHTVTRLSNAIRTLSFSFDGMFLAAASEDKLVDLSFVSNGERAYAVNVNYAINSVAWHPNQYLLAYAGEDYGGSLNVLGLA